MAAVDLAGLSIKPGPYHHDQAYVLSKAREYDRPGETGSATSAGAIRHLLRMAAIAGPASTAAGLIVRGQAVVPSDRSVHTPRAITAPAVPPASAASASVSLLRQERQAPGAVDAGAGLAAAVDALIAASGLPDPTANASSSSVPSRQDRPASRAVDAGAGLAGAVDALLAGMGLKPVASAATGSTASASLAGSAVLASALRR